MLCVQVGLLHKKRLQFIAQETGLRENTRKLQGTQSLCGGVRLRHLGLRPAVAVGRTETLRSAACCSGG